MDKQEAVQLIMNSIMEFATNFISGKCDLGIEFEKKFGDLGGDKPKGFTRRICGEVMAAFFVSSSYSLTTIDNGDFRYNKLASSLHVAMAGALSAMLIPQIEHPTYEESSKVFMSTMQTYTEYLNGVSCAGLDNFLSIIKAAGMSAPSDICKQKALAFRLWALVCLERVLLGNHFRPEKQGALCFMLIDDANRLSDNFEHIFTEYCGPSPFSSSESKKGCLLPLFLIFGVFFSGAVAGCKLFA